MIKLVNLFKNTERYSDYSDVAGEPTARLPYSLFAPAVVTHFPLFYKSHEDDNFESRVHEIRSFARGHAHAHMTLSDRRCDEIVKEIKDSLKDLTLNEQPEDGHLIAAVQFIWRACQLALDEAVEKQPELFVFHANTRIRLQINRFAHHLVVLGIQASKNDKKAQSSLRHASKPSLPLAGNPWVHRNLAVQAFRITNRTVFHFAYELIGMSRLKAAQRRRESDPSQLSMFASNRMSFLQRLVRERPFHPPIEPAFNPHRRLGGMISWFDACASLSKSFEKGKTGEIEWISGSTGVNRKFFPYGKSKWQDSKNEFEPLFDQYLVWRRGDRNWRYTFFDGCYQYLEGETGRLEGFLSQLLSSVDLNVTFPSFPSVEDSQVLERALHGYRFPGARLAGAQYFVLPAELLLVIVANFKKIVHTLGKEQKKRLHSTANADFKSTKGRTFAHCIATLSELEELRYSGHALSATRETPRENLQDALKGRHADEEELIAIAKAIRERMTSLYDWLADQVSLKQHDAEHWLEQFHGSFAEICEILWKCIYTSNPHVLGQDDFVSSTVIDGRAIYFSNFRPFQVGPDSGALGFTRTFFVDFRLTPYQRGRLVRRLCDIATYRLSCMRDSNRLHALSDGINQLNEDFNLVVSAPRNPEDPGPQASYLSAALADALEIYQRATEFNKFITEGVSGRSSAVQGDWAIVKKQVADIRERRLQGYAQIGDFLERGLAVSILEIEQISGRYENLIARISSHMSTIRTQLVASNMRGIGDVLGDLKELMNRSEGQSENQTHLLNAANDLLKQQTILLRAAELLVWLGGTYYLAGLLQDVFYAAIDRAWPGSSAYLWVKLGYNLVILFLIFFLVYWLKEKLPAIPAWLRGNPKESTASGQQGPKLDRKT